MLNTSRQAIAPNSTLYDTDFYVWTQQQAALIASGAWAQIDRVNDEAIADAYANAKDLAIGETDLPSATFPAQSPYSWQDATNEQFYSGEPDELLREW